MQSWGGSGISSRIDGYAQKVVAEASAAVPRSGMDVFCRPLSVFQAQAICCLNSAATILNSRQDTLPTLLYDNWGKVSEGKPIGTSHA